MVTVFGLEDSAARGGLGLPIISSGEVVTLFGLKDSGAGAGFGLPIISSGRVVTVAGILIALDLLAPDGAGAAVPGLVPGCGAGFSPGLICGAIGLVLLSLAGSAFKALAWMTVAIINNAYANFMGYGQSLCTITVTRTVMSPSSIPLTRMLRGYSRRSPERVGNPTRPVRSRIFLRPSIQDAIPSIS